MPNQKDRLIQFITNLLHKLPPSFFKRFEKEKEYYIKNALFAFSERDDELTKRNEHHSYILNLARSIENPPLPISELRAKIEELIDQKNRSVKSQKFEEAAALVDTERSLYPILEQSLNEYYESREEDLIKQVQRLCLRIVNGRLEVLIEEANGSLIYSDGKSRLENRLFVISNSVWVPILKQLENLINKANLKEQELQDFFEAYPQLILQDDYEKCIPQATIVKDDDIRWRADFVLVPTNQIAFAKVLELKLPEEHISKEKKSGHSKFYANLYEAINQLRDYHEAFNDKEIKNKFQEKYNVKVYKPDLHLLIGRRKHINDPEDFMELQRRNNVTIQDWDTYMEELKRKFK